MKNSTDARTPPARHVPLRTCVACRQVKTKRELVRIVRTAADGVVVDETGKIAGRGAYICKTKACWDQALKVNRMGQVLRTSLTTEDRQRLEEYRGRL